MIVLISHLFINAITNMLDHMMRFYSFPASASAGLKVGLWN